MQAGTDEALLLKVSYEKGQGRNEKSEMKEYARKRPGRGSATVEAAIVLPVFLIVLLSLAYILRVFYAYNIVQASLSEVARRIGNMSYFYHVTGAKDYSDRLNEMAAEAGATLDEQKSILMNAYGSFNEALSGVQSGISSPDDIKRILELGSGFGQNMSQVKNLIESVVKDPKAELKLVMTVFAQKLNYEITNRLVCLIAEGNLKNELAKRVKANGKDPARILGIKNGSAGIDFSKSSIFGDTESLELMVSYSIKAPDPLGLLPEIRLSNRVKIIAWTGGRGCSVKVDDNGKDEAQDTSGSSIWVEMDKEKRYWDRGLEIEDLEVNKILDTAKSRGFKAYATSKNYPVIDAYSTNEQGMVEYYDVFTLNPFLKTYQTRPSAIKYEIKRHGKRLLECDAPPGIQGKDVKSVKRVVVIILPENADAGASAIAEAQKELAAMGVLVEVVKGYGPYTAPQQEQAADEAA